MLRPFSAGAIAKRVMNHLNDGSGPLSNEFERFFYDADKLKTTSIVSYGLSHLVRPAGQDSFYSVWNNPSKSDILNQTNDALLAEYVQFCASEVNKFMSAVKERIPAERWTADRKVANRFLSTAHLNGCISCLRRIVKAGKTFSREYYLGKLNGLEEFNFGEFKSSQYNKLGALLYSTYFGKSTKST